MILSQPGGPRIELKLVGYQFATGVNEWHDLNWLNILVSVQSGAYSWTGGPDPCLLTTEVKELAQWLRAAAAESVSPLDFLEPELSFAVARPPDRRGVPVAVTMRHAFVSNQSLVAVPVRELPLLLYIPPEGLLKAASDLEAELAPFPVRNTS